MFLSPFSSKKKQSVVQQQLFLEPYRERKKDHFRNWSDGTIELWHVYHVQSIGTDWEIVQAGCQEHLRRASLITSVAVRRCCFKELRSCDFKRQFVLCMRGTVQLGPDNRLEKWFTFLMVGIHTVTWKSLRGTIITWNKPWSCVSSFQYISVNTELWHYTCVLKFLIKSPKMSKCSSFIRHVCCQ